jgi:hypothetical protein
MEKPETLPGRRPFLQYEDQLTRAHERFGLVFEGVGDPHAVGGRAQGKLAGVDEDAPLHGNGPARAVLLEYPIILNP